MGTVELVAECYRQLGAGFASPAQGGEVLTPAAVVEGSQSPAASPAAPPQRPVLAVNPDSEKAVAFLKALRAADIPTSPLGGAESEAAAVICEQLEQGVTESEVVRMLPAVLPDLTRGQSAEVVTLARRHYC